MKTEFMALWDVFATDREFLLLKQAFEIGIPDQRERAEILKIVLKGEKIKSKIDFDCIAILYEGSTGSDLLEPCKKAAYFPTRDLLDEENKGEKSSTDLQRVHGTPTKTRSSSHSTGWPRQLDDYQVQATTNGLSKLVVSQILNLQLDNQDP
ncbi:hypothetical protein NC653_028580 [Populus alba x Populus x berolinensis]|uniref:Uncharacterized protein n=2 Tax=Populus TaxID=3689 RepID=A0A4V6A982_POPAL|nr:hypothetical protein NC653_028580 [Populus alba x Populus x berolinensis]TKS06006.1 hypothetical protein D5086_0000127520 [Populus alba]